MPLLHFQNNLILVVVVCHSHELPIFPFGQKNALNCHLSCLILPAGSLLKISVPSVTAMSLEPNKQVMPLGGDAFLQFSDQITQMNN